MKRDEPKNISNKDVYFFLYKCILSNIKVHLNNVEIPYKGSNLCKKKIHLICEKTLLQFQLKNKKSINTKKSINQNCFKKMQMTMHTLEIVHLESN